MSARELHAILRRAYPSFGQATVYRTLEILVACMLAQAFPHRSCEVRCAYRSAYPRHHLLCTACGLVVEVPSETLSGIRQSLQEQHFALQEQALTLLGTCGTCQGRSGCNSARP